MGSVSVSVCYRVLIGSVKCFVFIFIGTTSGLDIERGSDGESLLKSGRKLRKSRVTAPLFGFYGGECLRGFYGGGVV